MFLKDTFLAWLAWLGGWVLTCKPGDHSLIPNQGTCPGCELHPHWRACRRQPINDYLSPFISEINKNTSFFKKKTTQQILRKSVSETGKIIVIKTTSGIRFWVIHWADVRLSSLWIQRHCVLKDTAHHGRAGWDSHHIHRPDLAWSHWGIKGGLNFYFGTCLRHPMLYFHKSRIL